MTTLTYVFYETGEKVGAVPANSMEEAKLDFWNSFLKNDHTDAYVQGNWIMCKRDGQSRVFIARAE